MKYKYNKIALASLTTISILSSTVFAAPFKPVTEVPGLQTAQQTRPFVKVGNAYEIQGIKYTPAEVKDYDVVGIASWYGEDFQGKLTANGEVYDTNQLTAAHPTLPLPSFVEVTNLDNGKKIIVRINDRGPFVGGRTIDLSKRSAELLGFSTKGTANVRVKLLSEISKEAANDLNKSKAVAITKPAEKEVEVLPVKNDELINSGHSITGLDNKKDILDSNPEQSMRTVSLIEPTSVKSYVPKGVFVQIGAYSEDNASMKKRMESLSDLGVVSLQKVDVNGKDVLRFRVGPYGSIDDAIKIKSNLSRLGYNDSRVVVEQ